MTLAEFLTTHQPLTAVDLLPDMRLINVVINDVGLYGVEVANIPVNVQVTRLTATLNGDLIQVPDGPTFDATQYVMLDSPQP